jgi:hypothetical protein
MKRKPPRGFRITFHVGADDYRVYPLAADPDVARKAFRFAKQTGDRAVYDLRLDEQGLHCECLGFLRWGRCKHCQTLQAAANVFRLDVPALGLRASNANGQTFDGLIMPPT